MLPYKLDVVYNAREGRYDCLIVWGESEELCDAFSVSDNIVLDTESVIRLCTARGIESAKAISEH